MTDTASNDKEVRHDMDHLNLIHQLGKVQGVQEAHGQDIADLKSSQNDHGNRISVLEKVIPELMVIAKRTEQSTERNSKKIDKATWVIVGGAAVITALTWYQSNQDVVSRLLGNPPAQQQEKANDSH